MHPECFGLLGTAVPLREGRDATGVEGDVKVAVVGHEVDHVHGLQRPGTVAEGESTFDPAHPNAGTQFLERG
jgi:hypothetical protein